MKIENITIIISLGMFVYLMMFYFLGPTGIEAQRDIKENIVRMRKNLDSIKITNNSIKSEISDIIDSNEFEIIKARNSGYYKPNEHIIKIQDYTSNHIYYAGKIINFKDDEYKAPKSLIRTATLITVFFVILMIMIFSIYKSNFEASRFNERKYSGDFNYSSANSGFSSSNRSSNEFEEYIKKEVDTRVIIKDSKKDSSINKNENS